MSSYWKVAAVAVGGLIALWLLTREDEEGRGSASSSGASPSPTPRSGPADSSTASGAASEDAPAAESADDSGDGGVVRDGRMRGGTWNFAPSDAPSDSTGFLVLRDVPKRSIKVDGNSLELRGGFRGFRGVPAGKHSIELEGYGGTKIQTEIEMPSGGCIVLIYDDSGGAPRLEPDRDWGPQYIGLAMGGAMGQALWEWPSQA